jgi:hypothetical protein
MTGNTLSPLDAVVTLGTLQQLRQLRTAEREIQVPRGAVLQQCTQCRILFIFVGKKNRQLWKSLGQRRNRSGQFFCPGIPHNNRNVVGTALAGSLSTTITVAAEFSVLPTLATLIGFSCQVEPMWGQNNVRLDTPL